MDINSAGGREAGLSFEKLAAVADYRSSELFSPAEKAAFDAATIDSDGNSLIVHFKTDDKQFQALMHTPLFNAISH